VIRQLDLVENFVKILAQAAVKGTQDEQAVSWAGRTCGLVSSVR
jgi:hypothetical protein